MFSCEANPHGKRKLACVSKLTSLVVVAADCRSYVAVAVARISRHRQSRLVLRKLLFIN